MKATIASLIFLLLSLAVSSQTYKEEFYKLKYCSTVVYMVPRA